MVRGAAILVVLFAAVAAASPVRLETRSDRTGRSYWLSVNPADADRVARLTVTYPNPDASSSVKTETRTLSSSGSYSATVFRRRFPAGEGPWWIRVEVTDRNGGVEVQDLQVSRPSAPVTPPARRGDIYVGICTYYHGSSHHENSNDIMRDILDKGLCNLCIGYNALGALLPERWPAPERETWLRRARELGLSVMSIYDGEHPETAQAARAAFDGRYLGDNVGEFASFMYQGRDQCPMPMNLDLQQARDYFVDRCIGNEAPKWSFPYLFSTCGATLSCYELAGGFDFICSELWAIGAQNLAYATAEARGAARKWQPEYWGGWNAHEWQSGGIPYRTDQKFDSLLAGFLQEYIAGTSMIILESGAQTPQAWRYTSYWPDRPDAVRTPETYGGTTAVRYRKSVGRFYEWVKAHPRGDGSPETRVAIALGNLDSYLGENGGYAVWSQHLNADADRRWKYGAPESTQAALEDLFYPRPDLLAPYRNRWLAGTPYGQADVMQIDDDSTLADLSRYEVLAFGGWNTMTPHIRDVLERYVESGGTLILSRPELTTRVDRDFENYTDADLNPLFDELPPAGAAGEYVESVHGKGRYLLFTARSFPAANTAGLTAYTNLIARVAAGAGHSARVFTDDPAAICHGVYPERAYVLNMDTVRSRKVAFELDGTVHPLTLAPCQIAVIDRATGEVELSLLTDDGVWETEPDPAPDPAAEKFCWTGAEFGAYADPANWRIGDAAGAAATRCPSWMDELYGYQNRSIDLGGTAQYVGGWSSTGDWVDYELALSNGTLCVSGTVSTHRDVIRILDSATLRFQYGSVLSAASGDAAPHRQYVEKGGTLVFGGALRMYKYELYVQPGGLAVLDPMTIGTSGNTQQKSVLKNDGGTLVITNSLALSTAGSPNANGRVTLRQTAGELRLGGEIRLTEGPAPFELALEGGTVRLVGPVSIAVSSVTLSPTVKFVLERNRIKAGEVFFRSTDATLLARVEGDVRAQLAGTKFGVEAVADGLVLTAPPSRGLVVILR